MRRLRARHHDDRAMTLVELTISMFIFGILGLMVSSTIVSVSKTSRGVTERVTASSNARVALAALSKDLRLTARPPGSNAPPFDLAEADRAVFTSLTDGLDLPIKLELEVVDGELVETKRFPSIVDDEVVYTGAPVSRVVARGIIPNDDGEPVFTYLDATGNDLGNGAGVVPPPRLGLITVARVTMTTKSNPNSSTRAARVTTTVRLVNEQSR